MSGTPAEIRPALAAEVLEVYGADRWKSAGRLMVIFSAGGMLLSGRLQAQAVRCRTAFLPGSGSPRVVLDPFPEAGFTGVLDAGEARVVSTDGAAVASRTLGSPPASRRWGDVDVLAFAGTTLWSWVALPLMLGDERLAVSELPADGLRRLQLDVPADWPVNSTRHVLHVDGDGRIVRHDEALSVFGRGLGVTSELSGHCDFEGVLVATHRRTRGPGRAGLLWADVVAAHLIPGAPRRGAGA